MVTKRGLCSVSRRANWILIKSLSGRYKTICRSENKNTGQPSFLTLNVSQVRGAFDGSHLPTCSVSNHHDFKLLVLAVLLRVRHDTACSPTACVRNARKQFEPETESPACVRSSQRGV
ncbi:hypothetical protein XENOCAPTIV_015202 [Xenoophorus captivus]|uniref:Uncharacterized protein n=1 Tax=Xenoophorus captivus TaxID=1517983 RepID=A0ABV0QA55_9TELE